MHSADTPTNKPRPARNLAIALQLAAAGYAVLPVAPEGKKKPLTKRGFKDATTDPEVIARWWARWPDALVGIATSCFWVLDIDANPSLETSVAALNVALSWAPGALEDACDLIIATPGGGWHLYFARTPGIEIGSRVGDIAPNIDTRGHKADGAPTGYIVAPGNMRTDGRQYRPIKGSIETLLSGELAQTRPGLIYLATFGNRERAEIRNDEALQAKLKKTPPSGWHEAYEAHRRAKAEAALRNAPRQSGPAADRRLVRYGTSILDGDLPVLTAMGRDSGRNHAAFRLAARIGRWVHHGYLSAEVVTAQIVAACEINGLVAEDGREAVLKSIQSGLDKARGDPPPTLPPLTRGRWAHGRPA